MTRVFSSPQAITPEWLNYIHSEATTLSQSSDFALQNYADSELLNPEVQQYLAEQADEIGFEADLISGSALSYAQYKTVGISATIFGRWARIKEKIRQVFCQVIGSILNNEDLDWKAIISAVFVALIPAFAGGIPLILLPVVTVLVASLMKYGYTQVCPV